MKVQLTQSKLGYGGTKSEMERLLADAEKLTGVKYDISNLGDVYSAIHVIQEDLGLTGVAAQEASTTFTGSLGAMKASAENLLANIALGEDLGPSLQALGDTIKGFLFNNLIPMLSNILNSVPDLLIGLGQTIIEAIPLLGDAAISLIQSLGNTLMSTDWSTIGNQLITSLKNVIQSASSAILGTDPSIVNSILQGISARLPGILQKGVELISWLVNGALSSLPRLIEMTGTLINQFVSFWMQNYGKFLNAGVDLVLKLVQGVISNLPQIVQSTTRVISSFIQTVGQNLPSILSQGILIVGKLVAGLISAIPQIVAAIPQLIRAITSGFGSYDWLSIGKDIVKGIASGLKGAAGMIADAAKDAAKKAFDAAKDFLGISSPAKKGIYIGQMYDEGIALGISKNQSLVDTAINDLNQLVTAPLMNSASMNYDLSSSNDDKIDVLINLLYAYLPKIAEKEGININQMYNMINRQLGWGVQ